MNRLTEKLIRLIYMLMIKCGVFRLLAKILHITAETGRGSDICLEEGFLPVPVHFYSPIPDIRDLEARKVWDMRSDMPGIDFRAEAQVKMLTELGVLYGAECRWPLDASGNPSEFFVRNPSFSYGCAAAAHSMIRHFRPETIIEIGSGMSSRVIARAVGMNGKAANYTIVDPYPSDVVRNKIGNLTNLRETRVELTEADFFSSLRKGDILFIDSGHSVKIGGDVNYLFMEILPRLAPGVIVHLHDINLPFEYPKAYAVNESFRQFWTEQYLLQCFLAFNDRFEVLLAMNYLMTDHPVLFQKAFQGFDPAVHTLRSGSFWMRRKPMPYEEVFTCAS